MPFSGEGRSTEGQPRSLPDYQLPGVWKGWHLDETNFAFRNSAECGIVQSYGGHEAIRAGQNYIVVPKSGRNCRGQNGNCHGLPHRLGW